MSVCRSLAGLLGAATLLVAPAGRAAEARPPAEVVSLQRRHAQETASALRPLRDRYLQALQPLVRSLTIKGDLEGAARVQEEIDSVKAAGQEVPAAEDPKLPPDLAPLRARYVREAESALRPIRDRQAHALQGLGRSFTARGDLQGALAVQAALEDLRNGTGALKELFGTWRFGGPRSGHIRTLHPDGTMSTPNFGGASGSWKRVVRGIEVSYPNGNTDLMVFPIDPAGTRVEATFGDVLVAVRDP